MKEVALVGAITEHTKKVFLNIELISFVST
jgi:hypothetical protein